MNKEANIQGAASATQAAGRRYDGKTVLVTGGGKGIGLAATTRFASEGARGIVFDHHIESSSSVSDAARQAGAPDAYGAAVDIGDEAAVVRVLAQAVRQFGIP